MHEIMEIGRMLPSSSNHIGYHLPSELLYMSNAGPRFAYVHLSEFSRLKSPTVTQVFSGTPSLPLESQSPTLTQKYKQIFPAHFC